MFLDVALVGPAPLIAVNGERQNLSYDSNLVCSEVCTPKRYWVVDSDTKDLITAGIDKT